MKGLKKRDMVQNVWEIMQKTFCKKCNFIRGSTKAAVGVCNGVSSRENTRGRVLS